MTISTGYRVYNSYKHYIGTVYQVQRQLNHNAVVNHVNLVRDGFELPDHTTAQRDRDAYPPSKRRATDSPVR